MKTILEADIAIYNDKTTNVDNAKKLIDESDYSPETKAYYNRLIRIKRAKNLMDKGEEFLFSNFYDIMFSITDMKRFYDFDKFDLPRKKSAIIKKLAKANFKFLIYTTIDPSFPPKDMDDLVFEAALALMIMPKDKHPKHVEAYGNFLAVDTYKYNVFDIMEHEKEYSRFFEYAHYMMSDYSEMTGRVLNATHPFFKELNEKKLNRPKI